MTNLEAPQPDLASQLLVRFAAGDAEAFEQFYRLCLPAARAVARRVLRDAYLIDDAVQEASIRAWEAAPRFRSGNGRAWFLCIVRNTALNLLAKGARLAVMAPEDLAREAGRIQERVARGDGGAMTLDDAAYLARISREAWFCCLARRDRQIVVMRFLGYPYGAIMRLLPDVTHSEIIRRALARAARNMRRGDPDQEAG